jgi:UDP-N-acetyl-D-galactosamine dehydrogenase
MKHDRKISLIGLGYVGLPVAVAFSQYSQVIGFDVNQRRISDLSKGIDDTNEVNQAELATSEILFTTNSDDLKQADFHIIAVPTPINEAKQPDLEPIIKASEILGKVLKKGDIAVYESTVYPGTTEEVCIPILESKSGLKEGEDFFIGYSPERINPGDREHRFTNIKKIVSAQQDEILDIVASVYGSVVTAGVHKAPSIKVAEAAKVIENTQRDINISLMNELALIFEKLDIDTGDVLEAAGTKWNFLPFKPGLVGGHCIGVDPYYLTYKAEEAGYHPQVILAGRRINDDMGNFIAQNVIKAMVKNGYTVEESFVSILGLTFKENVPDTRNTRVIDIIRTLHEYDVNVQIYDPIANSNEAKHVYDVEVQDLENLKSGHAVILTVAHEEFCEKGWDLVKNLLLNGKGIVFDVQGLLNRDMVPEGIQLLRL